MATGSIIWDIKNHQVESGPYPNATDANAALRKHLSKCGTSCNDKKDAKLSSYYEVVTVTL